MLNISSTTAVSWPTPVSTAVAPVSPAAAVQPVQARDQEGKAQAGFGREDRTAPQPPATQRRAEDGRTPPAASATEPDAAAPRDLAGRQQARQAAAEAAEQQQAKGKRTVEHLQQVLSNLWEASAAVVDRALGIEPSSDEALGNQSDTSPDLSVAAAAAMPRKKALVLRTDTPALEVLARPGSPLQGSDGETTAVDLVGDGVVAESAATQGEIVSYDENGNGNTVAVEAGSIIDQRV